MTDPNNRRLSVASRMYAFDEQRSSNWLRCSPIASPRGVTLSGGQRQRIAIARAVIRDAPILILDEPTSGLDAASEQMVVGALEQLMHNKTCIVIAHRLETAQGADVILVLEEEGIVEQGSHSELVQKRGLYSQLHELQVKTSEPVSAIGSPHPLWSKWSVDPTLSSTKREGLY